MKCSKLKFQQNFDPLIIPYWHLQNMPYHVHITCLRPLNCNIQRYGGVTSERAAKPMTTVRDRVSTLVSVTPLDNCV